MTLPEEIFELLKTKSVAKFDYVNPHFLQQITDALDTYYELEDEKVDKWVINMFSA